MSPFHDLHRELEERFLQHQEALLGLERVTGEAERRALLAAFAERVSR